MSPEELLGRVRRIEIQSRRMVSDVMAGEYQSAFKGRGMDFDSLRDYVPGDDPRLLDWKVTARLNHPYVKTYREERELTLFFVVDVSASGLFGSLDQSKQDFAARICAALAFNALKKNDRVGLLLFSDQVELFIPPQKGRTHVLRIIREVLSFQPSHRGTSLAKALEDLNRQQKKPAVVFLLSDFLDQGYDQAFQLTARRHDLVPLLIQDGLSKALPPLGLLGLEDLESGQAQLVDASDPQFQKAWRAWQRAEEEKRQGLFRACRTLPLVLTNGEEFETKLSQFFRTRSRRRA